MTIKLADYDLAAARARFLERVSRERGLVFRWNEGIDQDDTGSIRELGEWNGFRTSVFRVETSILSALGILPVELGGMVEPVEGGYAALAGNLRPDLPLVRALMVLRGHPCHRGFGRIRLARPEQPDAVKVVDVGPVLEERYAADPQPWSLAQLEAHLFEGARRYCGDVDVDPTWTPNMIYPGSKVGEYMGILAQTFLFDAFGAFDPSFGRRDALVGEWWLLQPVSPRLSHDHLGLKFGLHLVGYLPPSHVDAEGRVVMACFPSQAMSDRHRIGLIEDSKFVAGWKKVLWSKSAPPLADPAFDLITRLEGVTDESYGPYRHSTDLPPWPSPADAAVGS